MNPLIAVALLIATVEAFAQSSPITGSVGSASAIGQGYGGAGGSATATGGLGGAGGLGGIGHGGAASSISGDSNASANSGDSSASAMGGDMNLSAPTSIAISNPHQAPALMGGAMFPTAVCQGTIYGGLSAFVFGGLMGGTSYTVEECLIGEEARRWVDIGNKSIAARVMCMAKYSRRTPECKQLASE